MFRPPDGHYNMNSAASAISAIASISAVSMPNNNNMNNKRTPPAHAVEWGRILGVHVPILDQVIGIDAGGALFLPSLAHYSPPSSSSSSASSPISSQASVGNKKTRRTRMEYLLSEDGADACRRWYRSRAADGGLGEIEFVNAIMELSDFYEHEALDLFDLFDGGAGALLSFEAFHLIILLFASYECGQCAHFFSQRGTRVFDILLPRNVRGAHIPLLLHERCASLGRLFGLSERQLRLALDKTEKPNVLQRNEFASIFEELFRDWEAWRHFEVFALPAKSVIACCSGCVLL